MTTKTRLIISWILSGLLAFGLGGAGISKLVGVAEQLQNFRNWGYPEWLRFPIGLVEILLAIGLLWPRTRTLTLYGMVGWVIGAAGTHLLAGEANKLGGPAIFAVLALLDWLMWRKVVAASDPLAGN